MIRHAETDNDVARCRDVMLELRSHVPQDGFVSRVRDMEREGYRLVMREDNGTVVAVAGYRVSTNLFMGKTCTWMTS